MDREFDCINPDLSSLNINPNETSEHVPDIERQIRVIKERARSIRIKMLFKRIPKQIIIEILKFLVIWINVYSVKKRVSSAFSPHTIMNGTTLDW